MHFINFPSPKKVFEENCNTKQRSIFHFIVLLNKLVDTGHTISVIKICSEVRCSVHKLRYK